jgi:hypothetical protein
MPYAADDWLQKKGMEGNSHFSRITSTNNVTVLIFARADSFGVYEGLPTGKHSTSPMDMIFWMQILLMMMTAVM